MNPTIERLEPRRLLAAGDLDVSFGIGGRVRDENDHFLDFVSESLVLADGRILFAGGTSGQLISEDGPDSYLFKQLNPDGTRDESFGDGGIVTALFPSEIPSDDPPFRTSRIQNIAIADDGKIWAIGESDLIDILARFNADGSLDTSFGGDGTVRAVADAWQLQLQPDGRPLILTAASQYTLVRYNTDGTLDTTFGDEGTLVSPITQVTAAVAFQGNKILLAGRETDGAAFVMARVNSDGTLDSTFGDNGKRIMPIAGSATDINVLTTIELLPDGTILAAGTTETEGPSADGWGVVRLSADGDLDPTFGSGGTMLVSFGAGMSINDIAIDEDDNAYLAGHGHQGLAIARITPQGQLDESFGRFVTLGSNNTPFSQGIYADGITFAPDGKLLLRGQDNFADPPGTSHNTMFLMRLLTEDDGNPSPVTLDSGFLSIAATAGNDRIDTMEVGDVIYATTNNVGRVFDSADVDVVTCAAGAGNDVLQMSLKTASARVSGGPGRDRIAGGDKNDTLEGNAGRDFIDGGLGADLIVGGPGNDALRGQGGADRIYGRAGDDVILGNGGNDRIDGGDGFDTLRGGGGNDVLLVADSAIDQLFGDDGTDSATVDEDDILTGIEVTS